jgi:hypothetical protein
LCAAGDLAKVTAAQITVAQITVTEITVTEITAAKSDGAEQPMSDFEHDASFEQVEASGGLELDRYEACYQQLFSEALEDGVITAEERDRLDKAAERLGLDTTRLSALESALEGAFAAHHGVAPLHIGRMFTALQSIMPSGASQPLIASEPPGGDEEDELEVLRARLRFLEERVRQLETELEDARSHIGVEVDFSDIEAPVDSELLEEPAALHRRLRHDPRDAAVLHTMVRAYAGQPDRQWCVASALAYLGQASDYERELWAQHRPTGLINPRTALDATAWRRYLYHPEDEIHTSDILGVVVSAVLLAHSSALKGRGQLPELPADRRLDPDTSTVAAARAFGWAARTLGMPAPALYGVPDADVVTQMVPSVPPVCVLGKRALSGRTPLELAFAVGQHLAYYRRERFVRLIAPDIVDLEDLFLAALLVANRGLPLHSDVRARVSPIASAIEPLLEAAEIDQLRGAYQRFLEHGGRTNLARWATAADRTALRAGFTLCGDLAVAERMLDLAETPQREAAMDDLIVFVTGDRYAKLREHIGIAISSS